MDADINEYFFLVLIRKQRILHYHRINLVLIIIIVSIIQRHRQVQQHKHPINSIRVQPHKVNTVVNTELVIPKMISTNTKIGSTHNPGTEVMETSGEVTETTTDLNKNYNHFFVV